jgi:hypothetical protein
VQKPHPAENVKMSRENGAVKVANRALLEPREVNENREIGIVLEKKVQKGR